jgi:hypothetical protein
MRLDDMEIAIDALDEAGEARSNPLVEMLTRNAQHLSEYNAVPWPAASKACVSRRPRRMLANSSDFSHRRFGDSIMPSLL